MPLLLLRLLVLLLLLGWVYLPPALQQGLLLPLWVGAGWLIFITRLELARVRRQVWLAQYLQGGSVFRQRLQFGLIGLLWQLLLSLLLALLLLLQLLVADGWFWVLLALSLPLLLLAEKSLTALLGGSLKPEYLPVLVRRWSLLLVTGLLILLMLLVRLQLSQPWLIGLSWSDALLLQLQMQGEPGLLAMLLRLSQTLDITWQWLLQNALGNRDDFGWLSLLGWGALFVLQAAFCLAWMQLLVGARWLLKKHRE
ncbi:MAG: hypothetical protein IBX50_18710 [Marinospirillum sp.]|uniref:hypothetical protein n=1 Tax=Marinospirillum sp. TaxID=2183934 RepID=UPI0019EBF5B5|nr:hypothetical protein [Marinospirillum sp.]MBE0508720.1 hypothetical protein [Marinospirillum sp.]